MVKLHAFTKNRFRYVRFEKKIKLFIVTLYACIPCLPDNLRYPV